MYHLTVAISVELTTHMPNDQLTTVFLVSITTGGENKLVSLRLKHASCAIFFSKKKNNNNQRGTFPQYLCTY